MTVTTIDIINIFFIPRIIFYKEGFVDFKLVNGINFLCIKGHIFSLIVIQHLSVNIFSSIAKQGIEMIFNNIASLFQ